MDFKDGDVVFARVDRELKEFVQKSAQEEYTSESHIVRKAIRELSRRKAGASA